MRHRGTKASQPGDVHGYDWYDAATGAIDRCGLASQATRLEPRPRYDTPPVWLEDVDVPEALPGASSLDLARLDARARRAFVHATAKG
ncbi:MAG: hypothetical protein ACE37F_34825 [Nannocystaceae bacterium]|nr:hypothetical protein [bacterium]